MAGDSGFRVLCLAAGRQVQQSYCDTKAEADDFVKRKLAGFDSCVIEHNEHKTGWKTVESHKNSN